MTKLFRPVPEGGPFTFAPLVFFCSSCCSDWGNSSCGIFKWKGGLATISQSLPQNSTRICLLMVYFSKISGGGGPQTPLTWSLFCTAPLHLSAHYHNASIWNMFAVCTLSGSSPPLRIGGSLGLAKCWKLVSYSVEMVSYSSYLRKTLDNVWSLKDSRNSRNCSHQYF